MLSRMPYESIFNKEAVKNAQRTSRTFNMASNTYDSIPADRIGVLTEEAPLPSPEVLGDKSAAYCVWNSILKPIASDPTPMALRYLGTWAEGAAGLRAENIDLNNTDTADRYELLVRVVQEELACYRESSECRRKVRIG